MGRKPLPTTQAVFYQIDGLIEIRDAKKAIQERRPQEACAHLEKAEAAILGANGALEGMAPPDA